LRKSSGSMAGSAAGGIGDFALRLKEG